METILVERNVEKSEGILLNPFFSMFFADTLGPPSYFHPINANRISFESGGRKYSTTFGAARNIEEGEILRVKRTGFRMLSDLTDNEGNYYILVR